MTIKCGKYTRRLENAPSVSGFAAVASKKESEGPFGKKIDRVLDDALFGRQSWEQAESEMQKQAAELALKKAALTVPEIDYLFAGDLLNQCIASHYGMRDLGIPFVGLYGACSTMAESLAMAALFVECGIAQNALAVTSSHFCASERQFRFPLEYGGVRTPTAQWTVTGAGAAVIGARTAPPYVRAVTIGTIEDKGVTDISNMGAAMAPAAAETISRFLRDTGTSPEDYDMIFTGDLAAVGSELLLRLLRLEGIDISKNHADCGMLIYDREKQDVDAGGSGCGCAATILCSHILPQLRDGRLNNVLFCATGALMSTVSIQQGESIPGIAHLVQLSNE